MSTSACSVTPLRRRQSWCETVSTGSAAARGAHTILAVIVRCNLGYLRKRSPLLRPPSQEPANLVVRQIDASETPTSMHAAMDLSMALAAIRGACSYDTAVVAPCPAPKTTFPYDTPPP